MNIYNTVFLSDIPVMDTACLPVLVVEGRTRGGTALQDVGCLYVLINPLNLVECHDWLCYRLKRWLQNRFLFLLQHQF